MRNTLLSLVLAASAVLAQSSFGPDHNTTSIIGTWSSGTQQVVPGQGFANPAQTSFTYPKTPGVGYAFSDDGWYELARYRFAANGSHPECIIGTVVWAHGHYDLLQNGSIVLTPAGDGYQQVQSPCTKDHDSNFIQNYNDTELFIDWRIFNTVAFGPKLHLFQYDGSPVAPMFRLSEQPNMLPKQKLRNVAQTVVTTTSDGLVSTETLVSRKRERRAAEPRGWGAFWPW
ncbi:chaperone for protein-folding within the ER, fungal-domain-containing protein [Mycena belliarum]|uniref:Protein ROT1 n=1 Tax=Mycena belliarum TaxID=1033014 RepID=A0AAD6U7I5_9AGAR|nr:chaperone for protein-folding within the ER, fungal-domain-containing protein [Mycena belliae]